MKQFQRTLILISITITTSVLVTAQRKPELISQAGHIADVRAISISPDSKYLASVGVDKTIIVWDIRKQKQLYVLRGHSEWITSLAFSPDRRLLASGSLDGTVKLWNVAKGTQEGEISLQPYDVTSLVFNPSGSTLAISSTDKVIKLWDVAAKKVQQDLVDHKDAVTQVDFSPDGKYLASSSLDGTLILWDLASGTPKFRKTYKETPSLLFGPGEFQNPVQLAVTLRDDQETMPVNLRIGKGHLSIRTRFSKATLSLLENYNGSVPLPDTLKKALMDEFNKLLQGDSLFDKSLFDLNSFSAEIKKLAAKHPQGEELIRLNRMILQSAYPLEIGESEKGRGITSLAYSPTGTFVACATADNVVSIWNLTTQELTMYAPPQGYQLMSSDKTVAYHAVRLSLRKGRRAYPAGSLALNANNEIAFVDGFRVRLWNVDTKGESLSVEITSQDGSQTVSFNKEGQLLAFNEGNGIRIINLATNERWMLKGAFRPFRAVGFSSNGRWLLSSSGNWGDTSDILIQEGLSIIARLLGRKVAYVPGLGTEGLYAKIKEDEHGQNTSDIELADPVNNSVPRRLLKGHKKPVISIAGHPRAPVLMSCSEDGTIIGWGVESGEPLIVLHESATLVAFSPNGELLATSGKSGINIRNLRTMETIASIPTKFDSRALSFSPDNQTIAVFGTGAKLSTSLSLWSITGTLLWSSELNSKTTDFKPENDEQAAYAVVGLSKGFDTISGPLAFSPDSLLIACPDVNVATSNHRIKIWNVKTGKVVNTLPGHLDSVRSITFASNRVLASGSWDKTIKLWRVDKNEELLTLINFDRNNWVVYRPDGRFDTNLDLEESDALHWAISGDALNPLPLDIFMRDYVEPGLFERMLGCSETNSCDSEFKEIRDLSELNIVRPKVTITNVSLPDADNTVEIKIEVARGSDVIELGDGSKVSHITNVYDLRVFRNRQLIAVAPSDGAVKLHQLGAGPGNSEADLKVWREASEISLDPQTGKRTLSFKTKLPQGKDPAASEFTAYAFNDDRVKSPTARYEWTAEQKAKLSRARLNVTRRAYILSVGISRSHIARWNLNHGADDAYQFQKIVPEKLGRVGTYEVIPIELVSDLKDGKVIDNATKQNIWTVLDLLAGRAVPLELKRKIPNYQQIQTTTPDDLVLITFSSHGYSGKNGDLYLFPSDITQANPDQMIPDLGSLISGEELSIRLRDIDAQEIVFIIDACQSASAVQGFEFKPGPLGSRGLGQIAYDKKMAILSATQADNDALEVDGEINQGLLSYTLIQVGLVEGLADTVSDPSGQDLKITLEEWLEFGEKRVARIYKDVMDGTLKGVRWKRNGKVITSGNDAPPPIQRASLFDFSRQSGDIILAVTDK